MFRSRIIHVQSKCLERSITSKRFKSCTNSQTNKSCQQSGVDETNTSNVTYAAPRRPITQLFTHQVQNQVPPLESFDLYTSDLALQEFLTSENSEQIKKMASELGTFHWFEHGHQANHNPPVLQQFDRYGQRIDEVQFHPSYHEMMSIGMRYGVHSLAWETAAGTKDKPNPHGHLQHAAALYLLGQVEAGVCCPLSMTYAGFPVLRRYLSKTSQRLVDSFPLEKLLSRKYDHRCFPARGKAGLTIGMAMTEKQGGSDVRANTTKAYCDDANEKRYVLMGHKWFCSAPMCDGFLVLAQIQDDSNWDSKKSISVPSCFFVPRWLPSGERNPFHIQRLKDKLGNRSNASSEIEFNNTYGWLLGQEHDGIKTIIEMVHGTRLDSALGSAAMMRQALVQATWHARHRKAFGRNLVDQPLMKQVLVDLSLESEGATALVMYLATLFDASSVGCEGKNGKDIQAFARIATAIAKFWICKRTPETTYEALECLGGAGYVEESIMPRIYREAPLNSIWEGSGNVICLDILRAMKKSPESLHAYLSFTRETKSTNKYYDQALQTIERTLLSKQISEDTLERQARTLATQLALCLQASVLIRRFPQQVSDAFCAARLGPDRGSVFGDLPREVNADSLLPRLPA